jgi:hypothetical protein
MKNDQLVSFVDVPLGFEGSFMFLRARSFQGEKVLTDSAGE